MNRISNSRCETSGHNLMTRALLYFFLAASLAAAQSIETSLGELNRELSRRLPTNRAPSAGERLGAALDQTRATLRRLEQDGSAHVPGALKEERRKLALLDEA